MVGRGMRVTNGRPSLVVFCCDEWWSKAVAMVVGKWVRERKREKSRK